MGSKKKQNWSDNAHDGILGYATVVLGIISFIVALMVLIVAVRFVAGLGASANSVTTATAVATTTNATGTRR